MKIKTMTVSHPWTVLGDPTKTFKIEKLTDTTEFAPGSFLSKKEVDELCVARDWKVTIVAAPK
jgi:hypothetical protein